MANLISPPVKNQLTKWMRVWTAVFSLLFLSACNEEEEELVHESQIKRWQYLNQQNGLVSNYVNTIYEDSRGNVWIGTNSGLSVLSDGKITTYSRADGLLDDNVFAITEHRDGEILVGTWRGLNVFVNNQWFYYPYFHGIPVYALLDLKNEAGILIGTGGYGIYRFDYESNDFSEFYRVEGCDDCNSINALFQSADESVWMASFAGARKIRGNFITLFDEDDGLAGNIVTTIAEDSWGNIWIGTVEGRTISKIIGNTISQVTFNNGAKQNFIFGIQEDNDGNLWVGTVGNGLFHYDGAIMRQIYEGAPDNTITTLYKDGRGNLWVGTTEEGVAVYITNPLPN